MEGNVTTPASNAPGPEVPRLNFVQRLVGAYVSPQETYEDINRKGSWLGIFLIIAVLAAALGYLPQRLMGPEAYMRKALAMNPMTKNMSEEQIKQILDRPQNAFQKYSSIIFAPVAVLVAYIVSAAALLLIFVLMGGGLTFKKSLTFTIWGMAPPGLVGSLLAILFLFVKDPESLEVDPSANVVSNLGALVSAKEHGVLHSLLASIDLFSFWTIFLLALGFSVASNGKLSKGKAAAGVTVAWGIYVLGKVGFSAIFS
jgi:hypothetical protein